MNPLAPDAVDLELDYRICRMDFYYWFRHYAWMMDESGEIIGPGINLWPDQVLYLDDYRTGKWLICGKARRVGLSWLATLVDLYDLMFEDNIRLAVIAQDDFWAQFHLSRLKWVYEQQPPHIARHRPVVGKESKHEFGLDNGSIFAAYPCTPRQARGAGGKRIRLEEFALYADAKGVLTAAYGAMRDRGQLVIISTGQGEGGEFHKTWLDAGNAKNQFKQIFLGWRSRPDRPDNFREGMTLEQRQEFPETPEEMFLGSGAKYFNLQALALRQQREQAEPDSEEWNGCLLIYKQPVRGERYCVGADVADGGGDACAAVVKDVRTGETVAVYLSYQAAPDEFGEVLYNLGKYYFWAFMGVERNNMGHGTIAILQRLQYPNLYHHQHYDPAAATVRPRAGWITDSNSRPVLLSDYRRALGDPAYGPIPDTEIYRQLRIFGYYEGKWQHPKNDNDDLVFAEGICQQMKQYCLQAGDQEIVVYKGERRLT